MLRGILRRIKVLDIILLAAGIGALILTVLYAYACERM